METTKFVERRRYQRASSGFEVLTHDLPETSKSGKGNLQVISKNLGIGGIFLKTRRCLETDYVVFLRFTLPNTTTPITTMGKVVWNIINNPDHPSGIGIEFMHLGFSDQLVIRDFVEGQKNKPSENWNN